MNDLAAAALIVFARAPRAGRVKSRLAATLGADRASQIYARLLERALKLARHSGFTRCYLFCASADEREYFTARMHRGDWQVVVQSGVDLGERMFNAFATVLAEAESAVLIGSDIADSTTVDLEQARHVLAREERPAVLGPVADGGYWLLGLRQVRRDYFADIEWGTNDVAACTATRLQRDGLIVHQLAERHDVDVADDIDWLDGPDENSGLNAD